MPPTLTYPGVYIEELASTSHTIVGVATSITAFVGYTKRGPVNQATEVFSFGDFERSFGGLDPDCPLTYAVQQFFLNGGGDAFVVRVASGAGPASVKLRNDTSGVPASVLDLTASSAGLWGNTLRITVDRDTVNPVSLFNLTVTEYVPGGGALVPRRSESFRNLTMNSSAPTYAVDTIKNNSRLLTAERGPIPAAMPAPGTSVSGLLPNSITIGTANTVVLSLNGGTPTPLVIPAGPYSRSGLANEIAVLAAAAGLNITGVAAGGATPKPMTFTDNTGTLDEKSSVHFTSAPANDATSLLKLGVAAGGIETDAIATYLPMPTGTTGGDIDAALGSGGLADVTGLTGVQRKLVATVTVPGPGATAANVTVLESSTPLTTKEDLRTRLQAGLQAASLNYTAVADELGGASVAIVNNRFVVSAGGRPDAQIALSDIGAGDTTATLIGFPTAPPSAVPVANVAGYSPATAAPLLGQASAAVGSDGAAPLAADIQGIPDNKTGIYALDDVDLFNLLVVPDTVATDSTAITADAIAYCEQRRAMLILDPPSTVKTLTDGQFWIKDPGTPKSANAAAYFPRAQFPDPTQGYRPRTMPTAGAIAGIYARTDASRGVWKAPAGTEAQLRGPTGVTLLDPTGAPTTLTDVENGKINPLGLNAIRALPVYGIVAWGARTLYGADVMANEWKYVPVRRTALYIEESLYRGTKWVVFEPNDEPLWAQIRLSVGAFMHNLFRQGAFQGSSPRQAYLVKCDSETTTQNDIDLGVVNILVGFAPLKPAEFVVIQITQLAGQVDT